MLTRVFFSFRLMQLFEGRVSPREIAGGVCLGMVFAFVPFTIPAMLLFVIFFLICKINRVSTIISLPLFKTAYLLGLYHLTGRIGEYLLVDAAFLAPFWSFVVGLPVIAYFNLNNTLVIGGLVFSALLAIPVYMIAKGFAGLVHTKYAHVKGKVLKDKVRPSAPRVRPRGALKRVNVPGIAMLVAVILIIQFGTAYAVTPFLTQSLVGILNKAFGSRVSVETMRLWPLTLSLSVDELKIFDDDAPDKRILRVGHASFRISPLALLSKRLVVSKIAARGVEVLIEGEDDGSFRIAGMAREKDAAKQGFGMNLVSMWRSMTAKRDWFARAYTLVKERFVKKEAGGPRREHVAPVVEDLPKGKIVSFDYGRDRYRFEVREVAFSDAVIDIRSQGDLLRLADARGHVRGMAFDPRYGVKMDGLHIKTVLVRNGGPVGTADILYAFRGSGEGARATFNISAQEVDLASLGFIYEDSLPVGVSRGTLTLDSRTSIDNGALDSRNTIRLTEHTLTPKNNLSIAGFVPMPALCEALNGIDPCALTFTIAGTVEKPAFGGLQDSLKTVAGPALKEVQDKAVETGVNFLSRLVQKVKKD